MTPTEELAIALRELHLRAGKPSSRAIASAVGGVSHTTVSEMLRGSRVPAWSAVEKVGVFLGGRREELQALWSATQKAPLPRGRENDDRWDPVYLDRVVATSFVTEKGTRENRITERWIRATSDSVGEYVVRAGVVRGTADEHGGKVRVEPLLNCKVGSAKLVKVPGELDAQLVNITLAEPLNEGERGFFATRTEFRHSTKQTDFSQIVVTGQGAKEVVIRVQFSPDSVPVKCWSFVGSSDIDMCEIPPPGSARFLGVSSMGYVEFLVRDLQPASRVGIVWNWS